MKLLLSFLLIIFFIAIQSKAQSYLIVDDPVMGGYQTNFPATVLSSIDTSNGSCFPQTLNYDFDLDMDSVADIHFSLECNKEGNPGTAKITATAMGSFRMLYIPDLQYTGNVFNPSTFSCDPVLLYTDLVRRFESNDTIDLLSSSTQNTVTIAELSTGVCVFSDVSVVNEIPCALALYKQQDTRTYIYYMLVTGFYTDLHIHSVWSNDPLVSAVNLQEAEKPEFPNPTSGFFELKSSAELVQFFSSCGQLMLSRTLSGNSRQIDISSFPKGIYLMKLRKGNHTHVWKLTRI